MKKTLVVLSVAFLFASCKKNQEPSTKTDAPQTSSTIQLSPAARTVAEILSSVTVVNGEFHFVNKEDLIDMACYLTNLKIENRANWESYYTTAGVTPLEYVYDRIGRQEDSLSVIDTASTIMKHCSEFNTRSELFKFVTGNPDLDGAFTKNLEWGALSFILNESQVFYLEGEKITLSSGKLLNSTGITKIFDEYVSSQESSPPPPQCASHQLPWQIFGNIGWNSAGTSPMWTCSNDPHLGYSLIDNSPCHLVYKIVMTSDATIFRHLRHGNQNANGWMTHMGTYGTNVGGYNYAPWVVPTNILNIGANGYNVPTYGTASTLIVFNQTINAETTNIINSPSTGNKGAIRMVNWNPKIFHTGGCCSAYCYSAPNLLSN